MSKENTPTDPESTKKTAEEIENAERLELLNKWISWLEEKNGGIPAAFLVKKALVGKTSPEEKTDSE